MDQNVEAFVIALLRAKERHAQVAKLQQTCPLKCHVIEAVDGSKLSAAELKRVYKRDLHRPYYPFELHLGAIGCFLSHRKAWQAIVDSNLDAGLILEDDVDLQLPGFSKSLEFGLNQISSNQYFQYQVDVIAKEEQASIKLVRPSVVPLRTTAQLVGREAAERLLAITKQFDRPVDTFLQMSWVSQVETYIVQPSWIAEVSHTVGGTTAQVKSRRFLDKTYRNLMRPIYRGKVRMMSHFYRLSPMLVPGQSCPR